MSRECGCGVVNKDSKGDCRACGTARGMVWTPEGFKTPQEADAERNTYPNPTKKGKNSLWPKITDLESAKDEARQGFWAAIIVAGIITAFVVFQIFDFTLVDAVLFATIAWGIHRMSRTAAIAGLGFYILDHIYMWSVFGFGGIAPFLIFTMMFINSVRGTFTYNKMMNSKVNIRNVLILNALGLIYSLIALAGLFIVLVIGTVIGIDIESIDDTLLGLVFILVVVIVYGLSLIRFMPFTRERRMINPAESSTGTVELGNQGLPSGVKPNERGMSPTQRLSARSEAQRKPWLPGWGSRRIESGGVRGFFFALALAVMGPMAILGVTAGILNVVEGNSAGLGGLLVGAMFAGGLAFVTYYWLSQRKFGKSVCHLETLPGVIGGWFKASVEVTLPVETLPTVLVRLENVRKTGPSSTTVWKISERVFPAQLTRIQGDRYLVPVRFHIPARKDYYVKVNRFMLHGWWLKITAKLPGVDLCTGFYVPIFETDEAPPEEQTPEGGLWIVEVVYDTVWYAPVWYSSYYKRRDSKLIATARRENTFSGWGRGGRDLGWYFQTEAEAQECADKFRSDPTLPPVTVELRRQSIASGVKARENVTHTGGDVTPIGKDPEDFYRQCTRCTKQIHLEAIRCRYCDLDFDPEEVGSSIAPIVDEYGRLYDFSSEVKQCPACAKPVKVGAFICRYCKQEFTPTDVEISKMKALREKVRGVRRKLEAKQVR